MKCETAILQRRSELNSFIELLKRENVQSYLEIGSKFGGSLWAIGNSLPKGSKIVAVDLPHGDTSFKQSEAPLRECVEQLRKLGYQTSLILGDSTERSVIDDVYALGPFDAVFIDANHTLPYVKADWENYGKIGKLIAFHDISFFRAKGLPPHKKPIEVPIFWNEIKKQHRYLEIKHDPNDNGIGVLWPT